MIKPRLYRDDTTNWFAEVGIGQGKEGGKGHRFYAHSGSSYPNIQLSTYQSSSTFVDTGEPEGYKWYSVKIENKSSSCEMSLYGTLRATATSGLQTDSGMQPQVYCNRGTSGSLGSEAMECSFRYMECYNT